MRIIILFIILIIIVSKLYAQEDSLQTEKKPEFFDKEFSRAAQASTSLFLASFCAMPFDKDIRYFRTDKFLDFQKSYDDYLQFAPLGLMYGMKAFGVKSRSSWAEMAVANASSLAIMEVIVYPMKTIIARERPDGSENNSFPSGHTATAFACAHMFHKEYGYINPFISIAGYSMASITGITRVMNNRHWLSDVLFGAGIGILSTELGYKVKDLAFKKKKRRKILPSSI